MARRLQPTLATHKGHLNQKRQHLDPTSKLLQDTDENNTSDSDDAAVTEAGSSNNSKQPLGADPTSTHSL
jgi:hypothetical protein